MSNKEAFLHKPGCETVRFTINDDGTVILTYQRTLDPNEDLDRESFPTYEQGRLEWNKLVKQGYRKADGWHQCKRCEFHHSDYYRDN